VLDPHIEAESMDTAIKAAFATTDMKTVDQHFGAAESFAVYAVGPEGSHLVEVTQFDRIAMDGAEDKLAGKIESLAGCAVVYCNAVGASAIAQLKGADIQPLKVASGSSIAGLIDGLRS
jgi:nitrogen fixation protein NifX